MKFVVRNPFHLKVGNDLYGPGSIVDVTEETIKDQHWKVLKLSDIKKAEKEGRTRKRGEPTKVEAMPEPPQDKAMTNDRSRRTAKNKNAV
jgi:hypothetical protein